MVVVVLGPSIFRPWPRGGQGLKSVSQKVSYFLCFLGIWEVNRGLIIPAKPLGPRGKAEFTAILFKVI